MLASCHGNITSLWELRVTSSFLWEAVQIKRSSAACCRTAGDVGNTVYLQALVMQHYQQLCESCVGHCRGKIANVCHGSAGFAYFHCLRMQINLRKMLVKTLKLVLVLLLSLYNMCKICIMFLRATVIMMTLNFHSFNLEVWEKIINKRLEHKLQSVHIILLIFSVFLLVFVKDAGNFCGANCKYRRPPSPLSEWNLVLK